ncbi:MAG: TetR/AcrR family transcriptional regulator [bacterium]|nr:TetR/AcrR family transcriptional regulator [bacterium]
MNTTDIDPRIERTRRVVLDAAAELVSEVGFDNATIEGVSERCGVARSTIYRHWPDKTGLLVDAMKKRLILYPETDTGSVRTDIVGFLGNLVAWFETKDGVVITLSLLSAAHRDKEIGELHKQATRTLRGHLVSIIDRAKARGELPTDVDAPEAANELAGSLFYKKMVVHEEVDGQYVEHRVDRWLKQVGWKPEGQPKA